MICSLKPTFKCKLLLCSYLLCLFSPLGFASWYQGHAKKSVNTLNFDEVRTQTIKSAVADAAMQSNSFIQVEDIVLDGLLQSSKTILRSGGQIRRIEILNESVDAGILSVTVKVDIKPMVSCQKDHYSKSLLIAQFPLLKRVQAIQGSLFDIGMHTSKRFERQLSSHQNVHISSVLSGSVRFDNAMGNLNKEYLDEVGRYLAAEYNSQFILFGAIQDISLFEQVKEQILIDDTQLRRNFTFQLYLYDAIRGDILLQKNYHGEGSWQYQNNHIVDSANSLFWRTDYGRNILHTISSAVIDINDVLSCQQSLPQIIDKTSGQLVINIGQKHGVKIGDEFEMADRRLLPGTNGKSYSSFTVEESRPLRVIEVNSHSALLTSDSASVLNDGEIHNLVRPKGSF